MAGLPRIWESLEASLPSHDFVMKVSWLPTITCQHHSGLLPCGFCYLHGEEIFRHTGFEYLRLFWAVNPHFSACLVEWSVSYTPGSLGRCLGSWLSYPEMSLDIWTCFLTNRGPWDTESVRHTSIYVCTSGQSWGLNLKAGHTVFNLSITLSLKGSCHASNVNLISVTTTKQKSGILLSECLWKKQNKTKQPRFANDSTGEI